MIKIMQRDEPILRLAAKPVLVPDIGSARIQQVIADMQTAMSAQKDGIAIAAPQIGVGLRIFIVSGSLLKQADPTYKGPPEDLVFINPEITRRSREKKEVEEGCLSVRWLYGKVIRSVRVTLKALNEKSEKIERGAAGLLAQIFQHECDHLEGVLFTDRARELWEMSAEEIGELTKGNK